MPGASPQVWVAGEDACDIIRADTIVAVRLESDGTLLVRVRAEAKATVTLVAHAPGSPVPADFHRQLIRLISELAESSGAQIVRAHHDGDTWRWVSEPM
jgi:hypothetical protein